MGRSIRLSTAIVLASLLAWPAFGQAEAPWVDPPAIIKPPPATPPPPEARPAPERPPEAAPTVAVPPPARPAEPVETVRKPPAAPPSPPPRPDEVEPTAAVPPPPVRSARPSREAPPGRGALARPPRLQDNGDVAQERAARRLAVDYLDFWSAPNAVAMDATPGFYASRVKFHGRDMSANALFELKRRFIRRWPIRDYEPRLDTMRAECRPAADVCTVGTAFAFTAVNPDKGRRSQGRGNLELEISFATGRPVIISETSYVLRRGRGAGADAPSDDGD